MFVLRRRGRRIGQVTWATFVESQLAILEAKRRCCALLGLRPPSASERRLSAHNAVGQTYLFTGDPARALEHIGASPIAPDLDTRRQLVARYQKDPVVVREMYAALACWLLGRSDQALRHLASGWRLAREMSQPFRIAQTLWTGMIVAQGLGDLAGAESQAERLIEVCERDRISVWLGGGHVLRGWALAQRGRAAEGIGLIHRGCEEWEGTGLALIKPYYLGLLAEAYGMADRVGDGLATVAEALEIVACSGERWYEAELYRIRAALRLPRPLMASAEVESDLFKARGAAAPPPDVVVVAIDGRTGERLGLPSLPREWPRSIHGELVDALVRRGASVIAFDVHFARLKDPETDHPLVDAVARAGNVVLVELLTGKRRPIADQTGRHVGFVWEEEAVPPFPELAEAAGALASFPLPKEGASVYQFRGAGSRGQGGLRRLLRPVRSRSTGPLPHGLHAQ